MLKAEVVLTVMTRNDEAMVMRSPGYVPKGPRARTQTNAGLHILTAKATGLVVILLASTNKTKKIFSVSQIPF